MKTFVERPTDISVVSKSATSSISFFFGFFLTDVAKQKVWDSAGVSERHLQTGDSISGNEERSIRQLPLQDLSTDYMLF